MGGLKFAGGNLRGDQGPAPCSLRVRLRDCFMLAGTEESASTLKLAQEKASPTLAHWSCRAAGQSINAPLSFQPSLCLYLFSPPYYFSPDMCGRSSHLR